MDDDNSEEPEQDSLQWRVGTDGEEAMRFGSAVVGVLHQVAGDQLAAFADLLPFRGVFEARTYRGEGWIVVLLKERPPGAITLTGLLQDQALVSASLRLAQERPSPTFADIMRKLPEGTSSFIAFCYVGPYRSGLLNWGHVSGVLEEWFNHFVLPRVEELNRARVFAAIPQPPAYDVPAVLRNVYVVENTTHAKQGTCFHLHGVGLVTCAHVISTDNVVLASSRRFPSDEFRVRVVARDDRVDLAILARFVHD